MYGRDLPSYEVLAQYAPKQISRIYDRNGQIIDEFAVERRLFTPAEEMPDLVKHAFVAAEDQNFYTHPGFDVRGIVAAGVEAVQSRGREVRGASTITQQVMKNFLLSSDRTVERKIKELILAVRIENALDKERILELYLNEIFLGQNSYGVTAAALTYFNAPLAELTAGQAAYLAALAQRPGNLHPVRQYDEAVDRRDYVLRRMLEDGYIDQATFDAEAASPLRTVQSGDLDSFRSALPPRDYFTDEIRRQLSATYSEEEFFSGGLSIRATVDPDLQIGAAHALQEALENFDRGIGRWRGSGKTIDPALLTDEASWRQALSEVDIARDITLDGTWYPAVVLEVADQSLTLGVEGREESSVSVPREDIAWMRGNFFDNFEPGDVVHVRRMTTGENGTGDLIRWTLRQVPQVEGAFMAMDVNTGRVLAMQGGFSYQHSVFNRATQARRQPGSAFKPFVYAAALDSGYSPATIVVDAPIEINTPQGLWRPQNYSNQFYGPTPLRTGIEQSRNLMTVRLAQEVGMDVVASYAEKFGVYDDMSRGAGQRARRAGDDALPDGRRLRDVRQWRRAGGADAGRPGAGPLRRHDLPPRPADVHRLQRPDAAAGRGAEHRLEPRPDHERGHRLPAGLDDGGRGAARHRARRGQPAGADRRQDRHHERRQGRLVRRLLLDHRRRLLHRLRPRRARWAGRRAAASARRCSRSS